MVHAYSTGYKHILVLDAYTVYILCGLGIASCFALLQALAGLAAEHLAN